MNTQLENRAAPRILLIDQDTGAAAQVAAELAEAGYCVAVAHNAVEVLEALKAHSPELILTELRFEAADANSILPLLKENTPDCPVVAFSSNTSGIDVQHALHFQVADFVFKPATQQQLLDVVKKGLELGKRNKDARLYLHQLQEKNLELESGLKVMKDDQEAGRLVQLKMFPANHREFGDIHAEFYLIPSLLLSGDFVDYFRISRGHVGFFLADVSGHGSSSAFVTILLKTMFNRMRRRHKLGEDPIMTTPVKVLSRVSAEIAAMGLGKHVAMFYGVIELATNKLLYSAGGHYPPPILVNGDEVVELKDVKGLPLGLFENAIYQGREIQLSNEFSLIVFSDGVLELLPQSSLAEKEQFLVELIKKGNHTIGAIINALSLDTHKDVPDDIAVMTISRK